MENYMEFPLKIKKGSAFWPNNSTSGDLSEETQNTNLKEYLLPFAYCSVIYNIQDKKATQAPINRWMDKKRCGIYIQWHITRP